MSTASALEQYMLELVNAERARTGAQPLALNNRLNDSSEDHSDWMLRRDIFAHEGAGGSSAGDRMEDAGYVFSGAWTWGENLAWQSERGASGLANDVAQLHTALMNSDGHRENILNGSFREIGIGIERGDFKGYDAVMATQNFAASGSGRFVTGVAYTDLDEDGFYDPGEGLGGIEVRLVDGEGTVFSTTTAPAGGYQINVANGTYTLAFTGPGGETFGGTVTVSGKNVKFDYVTGETGEIDGGTLPDAPAPPGRTINGNGGNNRLSGTEGADTMSGRGGNDRMYGKGGEDLMRGGGGRDKLFGQDDNDILLAGSKNDRVNGGDGNDFIDGGTGNDVLIGGAGTDVFHFRANSGRDVIRDFDVALDVLSVGDGFVEDPDDVRSWENRDGDLVLAYDAVRVTLEGLTLDDLENILVLI